MSQKGSHNYSSLRIEHKDAELREQEAELELLLEEIDTDLELQSSELKRLHNLSERSLAPAIESWTNMVFETEQRIRELRDRFCFFQNGTCDSYMLHQDLDGNAELRILSLKRSGPTASVFRIQCISGVEEVWGDSPYKAITNRYSGTDAFWANERFSGVDYLGNEFCVERGQMNLEKCFTLYQRRDEAELSLTANESIHDFYCFNLSNQVVSTISADQEMVQRSVKVPDLSLLNSELRRAQQWSEEIFRHQQ